MKVLLDTHILLWWLDDDPKLKPAFRKVIADPANILLVSMASLWEIAIKHQIGKLKASAPIVAAEMADQGFDLLAISVDHLALAETMPRHHGDPFDHLLLAQAKVEGARLMTSDRQMAGYGIACVGMS